jgi:hypothetical protein
MSPQPRCQTQALPSDSSSSCPFWGEGTPFSSAPTSLSACGKCLCNLAQPTRFPCRSELKTDESRQQSELCSKEAKSRRLLGRGGPSRGLPPWAGPGTDRGEGVTASWGHSFPLLDGISKQSPGWGKSSGGVPSTRIASLVVCIVGNLFSGGQDCSNTGL